MNLASYNYYNFVANETLKEKAIQTLRTYGVGPCGPPGFYGTQDVHMKTEADVAAHLGASACIIYAQSFSTISSVIPSFSKRGDIIVADKAVNFAVRKGMQISRSTVRWYEHNDMEDLEKVLQKVVKEQAKKPLTRRFIITEGLFENIGDVVNLPKIVRCNPSSVRRAQMLTCYTGRAQTQVQIPPHPRRILVLRCPGPHRPRRHRGAKRRRR
jgi:serine palmitoyltransferase